MTKKDQLLSGIRVLDMSQAAAGPACGVRLAYLGAEVIKLESPDGDSNRALGSKWELNWAFIQSNQNKKGITLNLNTEKGREIFKRLLAKTDILLESFLPGHMERKWGLSHEALTAINPRLIHASNTGFGRKVTYSQTKALDFVLQAMAGWMASTGEPEGRPMMVSSAAIDFGTSNLLLAEILAALWHRDRTGKGQWVETNMMAFAVDALYVPSRLYVETGASLRRFGNQAWGHAPGNVFRAKDGAVYLRVRSNEEAKVIFKLMGKEGLWQDDRFNTVVGRWRNREEVNRIVTEWTEAKTRKEVFDLLATHGIQCALIREPGEVLEDPELIKSGVLVDIEQPAVGKVRITTPDLSMSELSFVEPGPAPLLGQDNYGVYEELLGYSEDQIDRLKQEGVM